MGSVLVQISHSRFLYFCSINFLINCPDELVFFNHDISTIFGRVMPRGATVYRGVVMVFSFRFGFGMVIVENGSVRRDIHYSPGRICMSEHRVSRSHLKASF